MSETAHPFEKTLGPGPYIFIGMFSIDKAAGAMGKPYFNPNERHPRFVSGCGTCAHCGTTIMNVYQIQTGTGDVFGVGCECINKAGLPCREMAKVDRAEASHQKKLRDARKQRKGEAAREEIRSLIDSGALDTKPHPCRASGTLRSYAEWILEHSTIGGVVFAVQRIKNNL